MTLTATPHNLASEFALKIYAKVLDNIRADRLMHEAVQCVGDSLFIHGQHVDLSHFDRVWIAGSGKASVAMAESAVEILGDRVSGGLIVTKAGSAEPVKGLTVLEGAHPVPDQSSLEAGDQMLQFARGCNDKDFVLYLLSGGSSAVMESLVKPLTLEDLRETTEVLLASGADIHLINSIRSRISLMKAGKLAAAFYPSTVVVVVLSDVVGNDLASVGSGPFLARRNSSFNQDAAVFDKLPERVKSALTYQLPFAKTFEPVEHFVIGSISLAIHSATDAARAFGLEALPFADPMIGEARTMARKICTYVNEHPRPDSCMIFGGETTVKLRGSGLGGRCQEMALAAARPISKSIDSCFLACGTDGTDGPTDAVGGIVDSGSLDRARAAGFTDSKSLTQNDSYHYLEASGGLIKTGPTGSNVNDLVLVVNVAS